MDKQRRMEFPLSDECEVLIVFQGTITAEGLETLIRHLRITIETIKGSREATDLHGAEEQRNALRPANGAETSEQH